MPSSWLEAYSELKSFIDANPRIEITPGAQCIPGDIRAEFYRLFDNVRLGFIADNCGELIELARPLSQSYTGVVEKVVNSLKLSEIKPKSTLAWFLKDPVEGLSRLLFDLLFDLLKGKIDLEDFEQQAGERLSRSFPEMFRLGYEHWVLLSLASLLDGDRALTVSLYGSEEDATLVGGGESQPGVIEESVSTPEETGAVSLEHAKEAAFVAPDIIVHSNRTGGYVSIRRDLFSPQRMVKDVSRKREWLKYRDVGVKSWRDHAADWPDMVLYAGSSSAELALVADYARFCRPEIIIECMERGDWFSEQEAERIRRNQAFFKPRLGIFIICLGPVPKEALQAFASQPDALEAPAGTSAAENEASEAVAVEDKPAPESQAINAAPVAPAAETEDGINIRFLSVGYDVSLLNPVIEELAVKNSDK
ncbi:MAG: hypothetical protein JW954_07390 [Dehalococcoidaceae bacterium]|nr:hypothetical protein [Dehalococcoidaceae bacterium]